LITHATVVVPFLYRATIDVLLVPSHCLLRLLVRCPLFMPYRSVYYPLRYALSLRLLRDAATHVVALHVRTCGTLLLGHLRCCYYVTHCSRYCCVDVTLLLLICCLRCYALVTFVDYVVLHNFVYVCCLLLVGQRLLPHLFTYVVAVITVVTVGGSTLPRIYR